MRFRRCAGRRSVELGQGEFARSGAVLNCKLTVVQDEGGDGVLSGHAIEPLSLLTIICYIQHEHARTLARNDYRSVPV